MENQAQPTPPSNPDSAKKSNSTIIIVVVIVAVIVIALIGYFIYRAVANNVTETALEKIIESQTGENIKIDKSGDTIKIKSEDGQGEVEFDIDGDEEGTYKMTFTDEEGQEGEFKVRTDEAGIDVPKELKDTMPIFEPSKMVTLNEMAELGIGGTFTTDKSKDDIKDFYLDEMDDYGWKKISEFEADETTSLSYSKDNQTATIIIFTQDDQIRFTLSLMTQ